MRIHLYEFRSDKKKLTCLCGWEKTMKTSDPKAIDAVITAHRLGSAAAR